MADAAIITSNVVPGTTVTSGVTSGSTVSSTVSTSSANTANVVAGGVGATGATGATGAAGADGQGVPVGGTTGQVLSKNSNTDYDTEWSTVSGTGDVVGPASATDNAVVRFDSTTGKLVQNSAVTIADTTGDMAGVGTLNTHTIPGGTDTLVGRATTDTLTNKTLTSPKIDALKDTNGVKVVEYTPNASGVNYLTQRAGSTGQAVLLSAESITDTDVYLNLQSQGTGTVRANGVDVATIAQVGEPFTATVGGTNSNYTDIQSALDAVGVDGGTIFIKDGTYTITSTLLVKKSKTRILCSGGVTIQCDGSSVSPLIKPNTTGLSQITIDGGKWLQTNATAQGTGFDFSDAANCWIRNVRIEEFGKGIVLTDTTSGTFYNTFRDSSIFNCNNGIEISGSQANQNLFSGVRVRPKAGGAGIACKLVDARGCTFDHCDFEPGTGTGITGVSIDATSRENTFVNCWIENNDTNVTIASGATRNNFIGCSITSALITDLTDNGTDTGFFNTSITGVTRNKLGTLYGTLSPSASATYNLGASGTRWGTVYGGSLDLNNASAITLGSGSNIVASATTGTKIGTGTTQKLGFWNTAPIAQPTGNALTALSNIGLVATPTLASSDVGLGNVDNTSNATERAATATLTNKRITKRTGTTTSSATPTINTDNVDFYSLTAQAVDITSFTTNLSGTPTTGQTLWIAITGTAARAITWGASFEASTVALPTTTVTTNRLDVGFIWTGSIWRCIAAA